jgi:acyl-CoA thioesterase YciA
MPAEGPHPSAAHYHAFMPDSDGWLPALRNLTSPKDANHQGSVFGGVILSLIDQAGYVEARRHGVHRWVTIAMDAVQFHQPVWMGDIVTAYTRTARTGTTSVTVQVRVEAERYTTGERVGVTEATMTLVATDANGKPIPFRNAPSMPVAQANPPSTPSSGSGAA